MLISLAALLLAFMPGELPDGFSKEIIKTSYNTLVPATCLLSYTSEVTNPSTGETSKRDSSALGLIVSPEGLVMAPGHMQLEDSEPVSVTVTVGEGASERKYDAVVLEKPRDVNVCFLKVQSSEKLNLPYARFTQRNLELGDPLMLVGVMSETMDYARGVVTCRIGSVLEKPRKTYCLDTSVRFGFVSGPVVNDKGEVVGVVGFDMTSAEGGDIYVRSGHPLVYQAELFQKYIDHPQETFEPKTGEEAWLGVFTQPLNDDFAEYWGLEKNGGLIVSSIVEESPAAKAGLKAGDIIVNFNGVPIKAKLDREVVAFTKLVRETPMSEDVKIDVLRDGKPMQLTTSLAPRPKSSRDAGEYKDDVIGITVREVTTDLRILLNLSDDVQGVIVRRVKSGSVADLAGVRPGIIIMSLGGYDTDSIEKYKETVDRLAEEKPKEFSAFCRAGTATGFFRLEPRWDAGRQSDTVQAK